MGPLRSKTHVAAYWLSTKEEWSEQHAVSKREVSERRENLGVRRQTGSVADLKLGHVDLGDVTCRE